MPVADGTGGADAPTSNAGPSGGATLVGGASSGGGVTGGSMAGANAGMSGQSGGSGGAAAWVHPGVWLTNGDFERMRTQTAASAEPWTEARGNLLSSANKTQSSGAVAHQADAYALQDGGNNILKLAIAWAITGDDSYGNAARDQLDEWSAYQDGGDGLRNGIGGAALVNAAEIIRHVKVDGRSIAWPASAVAAFETMLQTRLAPLLRKYGDGGWGTPCINALIAIGVFCENSEIYAEAVQVFENGPRSVDPTSSVCCGVLEMIDDSGQSYDSGRDQAHAQFLVGHLFQAAITAFHQGLDLFSYGDNRLLLGMEYGAKYNSGNDDVPYRVMPHCDGAPPWGPTISAMTRGKLYVQYEASVAFYEGALGLSAPYSKQVTTSPGYFPESNFTDAFGYGTLLYRGLSQ